MKMFILFWIAAVWTMTLSSCGNSNAESPKKGSDDLGQTAVIVRTQVVQPSEFAETIKLTGSIESIHDIVVPAEESGRVVEWLVNKGSAVSPGQVMARLDDALLKAAFDAAEASFKMAEVNFEKQKKAYDEQAVSELQLKNLEFQRDAARAQLDMARKRWDNTRIVSPVHGVVNDRYVDEGEMIGAGMPAAHVVDIQQLKIALGIPERYAGQVRTGMKIDFTVDAFPSDTLSGTLGYVGPAVTVDNRTIPAEVHFSNTGPKIKPHMIARVTLTLGAGASAIAIPLDYVQQVDVGRQVVYIAKDGKAVERTVTLGGSDGQRVRILNGLAEGDELITAGFQMLVNDQPISIQN